MQAQIAAEKGMLTKTMNRPNEVSGLGIKLLAMPSMCSEADSRGFDDRMLSGYDSRDITYD